MRFFYLGVSAVLALDTSSDLISVALAPSSQGSALYDAFANSEAKMESAASTSLEGAYSAALARAKAQISAAIHSSFLRSPEIDVRVMDAPSQNAHASRVGQVESLRSDYESKVIAQAASEFDAITGVVVGELRAALHGSFLQKRDLNVKVKASSVPWAGTVGLLENREIGRDAGESALRHKILSMQVNFMKQLNDFIASSLA